MNYVGDDFGCVWF